MKEVQLNCINELNSKETALSLRLKVEKNKKTVSQREIRETLLNNNLDINLIDQIFYKREGCWTLLERSSAVPLNKENVEILMLHNTAHELKQLKKRVDKLEKMLTSVNYQGETEYQLEKKDSQVKKSLYFAHLHSYPLVVINNGMPTKAQEILDFQNEITNFYELFTKHNVSAIFELGSKKNFVKLIARKPKILHISCHGIPGDSDLPGKEREYYLYFENEDKSLDKFYYSEISNILEENKECLNKTLVVLSACYSGSLAKLFQKYCPFVLTIHEKTKVLDTVAFSFVQHFYENILNQFPVKYAAEVAKNLVKTTKEDVACCCSHSHNKECALKNCELRGEGCALCNRKCNCSLNSNTKHELDCTYLAKLESQGFKVTKGSQYAKVCCCDTALPHSESDKFMFYYAKGKEEEGLEPSESDKSPIQNICRYYNNQFNLCLPSSFRELVRGRNVYIYDLIQSLVVNRYCIYIHGEEGMGKRSIANFLAYHCYEAELVNEIYSLKLFDTNNNFYEAIKTQISNESLVLSDHSQLKNYLLQNKNLIVVEASKVPLELIEQVLRDVHQFCYECRIAAVVTGSHPSSNTDFYCTKVSKLSDLSVSSIITEKASKFLPKEMRSEIKLKNSILVRNIDGKFSNVNLAILYLAQGKKIQEIQGLIAKKTKLFSKDDFVKIAKKILPDDYKHVVERLFCMLFLLPNGIKNKNTKAIIGKFDSWFDPKKIFRMLNKLTEKNLVKLTRQVYSLNLDFLSSFECKSFSAETRSQSVRNLVLLYANQLRQWLFAVRKFNKDFLDIEIVRNESIWLSLSTKYEFSSKSIEEYTSVESVFNNIHSLVWQTQRDSKVIELINEEEFREALEQVVICTLMLTKIKNSTLMRDFYSTSNKLFNCYERHFSKAIVRNKLFNIVVSLQETQESCLNDQIMLLEELLSYETVKDSYLLRSEILATLAIAQFKQGNGGNAVNASLFENDLEFMTTNPHEIDAELRFKYLTLFMIIELRIKGIQVKCDLDLEKHINRCIMLAPHNSKYRIPSKFLLPCWLYLKKQYSEAHSQLSELVENCISLGNTVYEKKASSFLITLKRILSTSHTNTIVEFRANFVCCKKELKISDDNRFDFRQIHPICSNVIHEKSLNEYVLQNIIDGSDKATSFDFWNLTKKNLANLDGLTNGTVLYIKSTEFFDETLVHLLVEGDTGNPVRVAPETFFAFLKRFTFKFEIVILAFLGSNLFVEGFKQLGCQYVLYFDVVEDVDYLFLANQYPKYPLSQIITDSVNFFIKRLLENNGVTDAFGGAERKFYDSIAIFNKSLEDFFNIDKGDFGRGVEIKLDKAEYDRPIEWYNRIGKYPKRKKIGYYGSLKVVGRQREIAKIVLTLSNRYSINVHGNRQNGISTVIKSAINHLNRIDRVKRGTLLYLNLNDYGSFEDVHSHLEEKGLILSKLQKEEFFLVFNSGDKLYRQFEADFNSFFINAAQTELVHTVIATEDPIDSASLNMANLEISPLSDEDSADFVLANVQGKKLEIEDGQNYTSLNLYLSKQKMIKMCKGSPSILSLVIEKINKEGNLKLNISDLMSSKNFKTDMILRNSSMNLTSSQMSQFSKTKGPGDLSKSFKKRRNSIIDFKLVSLKESLKKADLVIAKKSSYFGEGDTLEIEIEESSSEIFGRELKSCTFVSKIMFGEETEEDFFEENMVSEFNL